MSLTKDFLRSLLKWLPDLFVCKYIRCQVSDIVQAVNDQSLLFPNHGSIYLNQKLFVPMDVLT
jgi:hypothetical protein